MLVYFLIFLQFVLLLVAIGFALYIGLVMISFKNRVPYVPTAGKVIKQMIEVANIQEGEKVVDLGSGTGRIVFAVAKKNPVEAIGIERSWILYLISKIRSLFRISKGKIKFIRGDFHKLSLKDANTVLCFLTPEGLLDIQDKLAQELPKGAKFISNIFPLEKKDYFKETKIPIKEKKKTNYLFIYNLEDFPEACFGG